MTPSKPRPSREVLTQELTTLYADQGEDALLTAAQEAAGDKEVWLHTVPGTDDVCVHIAEDPDKGCRGPTIADALVMALLLDNESKR